MTTPTATSEYMLLFRATHWEKGLSLEEYLSADRGRVLPDRDSVAEDSVCCTKFQNSNFP